MGGRPPTVSDVEILRSFTGSPDPVLFTTEVADVVGLSQQGIYKRLSELESNGYVRSKAGGNARVWWITREGRVLVVNS